MDVTKLIKELKEEDIEEMYVTLTNVGGHQLDYSDRLEFKREGNQFSLDIEGKDFPYGTGDERSKLRLEEDGCIVLVTIGVRP